MIPATSIFRNEGGGLSIDDARFVTSHAFLDLSFAMKSYCCSYHFY